MNNDRISIYIQVAEEIKKDIKLGKYPLRSKLPTIKEFALSFNVSTDTVRMALVFLNRAKEGAYVVLKHGVGTFVTSIKFWEN